MVSSRRRHPCAASLPEGLPSGKRLEESLAAIRERTLIFGASLHCCHIRIAAAIECGHAWDSPASHAGSGLDGGDSPSDCRAPASYEVGCVRGTAR
jgi:hypothetical protein